MVWCTEEDAVTLVTSAHHSTQGQDALIGQAQWLQGTLGPGMRKFHHKKARIDWPHASLIELLGYSLTPSRKAVSLSLSLSHAHACARTHSHACTHACTHTHTHLCC